MRGTSSDLFCAAPASVPDTVAAHRLVATKNSTGLTSAAEALPRAARRIRQDFAASSSGELAAGATARRFEVLVNETGPSDDERPTPVIARYVAPRNLDRGPATRRDELLVHRPQAVTPLEGTQLRAECPARVPERANLMFGSPRVVDLT
jgi:hypothetical protein